MNDHCSIFRTWPCQGQCLLPFHHTISVFICMIVRFSTSMLPQKFVKQHFYFVLPAGVLFTAKTPGCKTIKNKRCLQMLESIPKLAVGRPKKPVGYLVDTPRHLQDINKQKKHMKQENQQGQKFTKNDSVDAFTLYVPKWPRSGPALFWP